MEGGGGGHVWVSNDHAGRQPIGIPVHNCFYFFWGGAVGCLDEGCRSVGAATFFLPPPPKTHTHIPCIMCSYLLQTAACSCWWTCWPPHMPRRSAARPTCIPTSFRTPATWQTPRSGTITPRASRRRLLLRGRRRRPLMRTLVRVSLVFGLLHLGGQQRQTTYSVRDVCVHRHALPWSHLPCVCVCMCACTFTCIL